jgi:hypothetical protein
VTHALANAVRSPKKAFPPYSTIHARPRPASPQLLRATLAPVTFGDPDDVLAAMGLGLDVTG